MLPSYFLAEFYSSILFILIFAATVGGNWQNSFRVITYKCKTVFEDNRKKAIGKKKIYVFPLEEDICLSERKSLNKN